MPRIRDFRGLNPKSFDGRGNYAMGLKEQIIFPEISYDQIEKVRGMDIIVTTTAKTDDEALYRLYVDGRISVTEALANADSRNDLALRIRLAGGAVADTGLTIDAPA